MTATSQRPLPRGIAADSLALGVVAGLLLLIAYLDIIGLVQGVGHAFEQLAADAWYIAPITVGFGTQIALFAELRRLERQRRANVAVTAAGTGTSAAAMLACCAHHLADFVPLLGLSAATVLLDEIKTPMFLLGIGLNGFGALFMARQLRRARRPSMSVGSGAVPGFS